jgi:hypothetical protein
MEDVTRRSKETAMALQHQLRPLKGQLRGTPRGRTKWLDDGNLVSGTLPLQRILENSVYYPACGSDFRPISYLHRHFQSFVYADYGFTASQVMESLESLAGFTVVNCRDIAEAELVPAGWQMPERQARDPDLSDFLARFTKPFFGLWVVLANSLGKRVSLLYLGKDGVAVYQSLYVRLNALPGVIALIQPGHAFGGNWTNFYDQRGPLGQSVCQHAIGSPEFLLHGGIGDPASYGTACWTEYRELVSPLEPGLNLWRKAGQ